MLRAELFLRLRFVPHLRHIRDHRFLLRAQRPRRRIIVDLDRVAVFRHERVQRVNQTPRRTVDHRLERRMNVFGRAASPFFAARDQFQFDHAFGTEVHGHDAVQILRCRGHEYADAFRQCRLHFRLAHDLPNMRRTDFLFAFRHHHEVNRQFLPRAADRVQRRQKRRFRSFLIHRPAADDRFAQRRFVHQRARRSAATSIPPDRTASRRT